MITVTDIPPIAENECVEIQKNKNIIIDVLKNDTDNEHDHLFIESIIQLPKYGIAIINQAENITYTPNEDFCGRDTFYYEVCDRISGCDTGMVCIFVECECVLPQVITPENNDGFNDYLVIPCIYNTDANIFVWNRWGLLVYENKHYRNDWNGTYKGEYLPAGTYWYAIDYFNIETNMHVNKANYFMIIK
jgi:gliding motility-associated-like protein